MAAVKLAKKTDLDALEVRTDAVESNRVLAPGGLPVYDAREWDVEPDSDITAEMLQAGLDVQAEGGGEIVLPSAADGYAVTRSDPGVQESGGLVLRPGVYYRTGHTKLFLTGNTQIVRGNSVMGASTTITEDTVPTDTTVTVTSSASFSVGQEIFLRLGEAPYDEFEPDWWLFAKVSDVPDSTHITLDRPVCYALDESAVTDLNKKIQVVTELLTDTGLLGSWDLINPMTGGANAEAGFNVQFGRNIKVEVLSGQDCGAGLLGLQFVDGAEVGMVNSRQCARQGGQASKGRGISLSESRNVTVKTAMLRDCEGTFLTMEGRMEGCKFDSLMIDNGLPGRSTNDALIGHLGNGRCRYGDLLVMGKAAVLLNADDTSVLDVDSAVFDCDGDPILIPYVLPSCRSLRIRDTDYREVKRYSKTVMLVPSQAPQQVTLPSGLVRRLRVYASTLTGITSFYLVSLAQSGDQLANLSADALVELVNAAGLGSGYAFNASEAKLLNIGTDATVPVGAYITVEVEYFPAAGDDGSKGRLDEPATYAPFVALTHSVAQAMPNSANTALTWDTEREDTHGMHAAGNPTRLVCVKPGVHQIATNFTVAANGTGARYPGLQVIRAAGGGAVEIDGDAALGSGSIEMRVNLAKEIRLLVGDYIEVTLYQNSGGNLNVTKAGERSPEVTMRWARE